MILIILPVIYEILALVIQDVPTEVEVANDAHGDFNKTGDVILRIILSCAAVLITIKITDHTILDSALLTSAMFFASFDYRVTHALIKNKKIEAPGATWFNTTGKEGWFDRIPLWVKIGPWGRFAAKAVVLILAVVNYFVW